MSPRGLFFIVALLLSFSASAMPKFGGGWSAKFDESTGSYSVSWKVDPKGRLIFLCHPEKTQFQFLITSPVFSKALDKDVFMRIAGDGYIDVPNTGWRRFGKDTVSRLFSFEVMKTIADSRVITVSLNLPSSSGGVSAPVFEMGKEAINHLFKQCR